MVRNTIGKKEVEYEFKNVSDFRKYLLSHHTAVSWNNVLTRESYKFFQTHSWTEFENYMEDGNPDITADIKKHTKYYVDKFSATITESSQYQFDVVGEFFDIGAVMVGEPEAWIKEIKIEDDKFITLDIQGIYKDGTDLDMVRKNGSKIFAIATILEQQGFLVKINMHYSGKNAGVGKTKFSAMVTVKDYDHVLDYKKFGILLGVPFFRRGILRLMEIEYGTDLKSNFGNPSFGAVDGEIRLDSSTDLDKLEQKLMEV